MRNYYLLIMLLTFNTSCISQNKDRQKLGTEIVDPIADQPFSIIRKGMVLKLPDSIGGKKNEGQFFVQLKLDSTGKITSYDLLKLMYKRDDVLVCDFSQYPGEKETKGKVDEKFLLKITPVINAYIYNDIGIKRNQNQKASAQNILKFLTRLE